MLRKLAIILLLLTTLSLSGCAQKLDGDGMVNSYTQISQEQAKEMMAREDGHIIVDVRRQDEYDAGHIPGAILIPNESIGTEPPEELPDLDQIILIYCRSGNRSKQAAQKLFDMGYTNIYEFGGIIDWTGEIVTEEIATENPSEVVISEDTTSAADRMLITITAGDHGITATLYDNPAGRTLWDKLPMTLPMMNLYGREMCYRFGAGGLPDDDAADTGYEIGDISYWPPAGSLVILYKQNGEIFEQQPIGHTEDDVSFFDGMPDTDVTFERAEESAEVKMILKIHETEVPVTWESNDSVEELKGLLPLTIQMSMYGGFEQVGPIGQSIAWDDQQTTTRAGDIVLYSGNQIVVFYGSNSWAYTKLGHVDLTEQELAELLGNGDVTITISAE